MLVVISILYAVDFLGFRCDLSLSLVVIDVPLRAYVQDISVFDLARSWGLERFPWIVLGVSVIVSSVGVVNMSQRCSTVLLALGVKLN